MIDYETFKKVELKVAKIISAQKVEGSEKLLKLEVDLGSEKRQIVAGIGKKYIPQDLVGKNIIIVSNLEPKKLMGLESQGMLLAASNDNEGPVLLTVMEDISAGSQVK
jgi:methionine--tRNA ligase beta chain